MEEKFVIQGGRILKGEIEVEASKNAFLPILASTILCEDEIFLKNAPQFTDIDNMCEILKILHINTKRENGGILISPKYAEPHKITHELTNKLRASIFVLGAMLGRFRQAVISYPGGCNIGTRPIDIHINGLKSLGVKLVERHGYIYCNGQNMKAGTVILSFASVGATESLMMASVCLKGRTILQNVAKEPEVQDLQNFLNSKGAKISGAGTDTIVIDGVEHLHGGQYTVMPDRIIAGTHLILSSLIGEDVLITNTKAENIESLLKILRESACNIDVKNDRIRVKASKSYNSYKYIETMPYPLFPTDLQPQMMVFQSHCIGTCVMKENLFENRFNHVMELTKMGADILVKERIAIISGVDRLYGADVFASDLRAGAALVIAGLTAEGYTTVHNVQYIDRGYEALEKKYQALGADIKRVKLE